MEDQARGGPPLATTSFLYHAQGIRGYQHLRTEYRSGACFHHVSMAEEKRACAACGAGPECLTLDGRFERTFSAAPVGGRPEFIVLHGHQQHCMACGTRRREPIRFADGSRSYTKRFGQFLLQLCASMTLKDVARRLGVGWDLVKELHKASLQRRVRRRKLSKVRRIGIDEFAVRKGHSYMTVVVDLDSGHVLHVGDGKGASAVEGFLRRLKRARAPVVAAAMDMSGGYAAAVRRGWGGRGLIVHDRYHVVALANKAVDETRRDLVRKLTGVERRGLKGTRYRWLYAAEELNDHAIDGLLLMAGEYEPLVLAWLMKELLRDFWSLPSAGAANRFLDSWIRAARELDNRHFDTLATTLETRRAGLVAWFQHPITTGPVEGLNNKIKVLKRVAYGYRDDEYFKLRLLTLHEARVALTAG